MDDGHNGRIWDRARCDLPLDLNACQSFRMRHDAFIEGTVCATAFEVNTYGDDIRTSRPIVSCWAR